MTWIPLSALRAFGERTYAPWALTLLATIGAVVLIVLVYPLDFLLHTPLGIHYIRQSDSLAFIQYFQLHPWSLLHPGTLDMHTAPMGGAAAGEFPIMYWLVAWLQRLTGCAPAALCVIQLTIVLIGHIAFVRAIQPILRSAWLALGIGLWMFGSSVAVFYGCNYLPDATAYGLVLIGWSFVLPSLFDGRMKIPFWSVFLFTLAGMIKAPVSMHLIAIAVLGLAQVVVSGDAKGRGRRALGSLMLFVPALLVVAAWHYHAMAYNEAHGTNYFLTGSSPIWSMTEPERSMTWDLITRYWWTKYLHPTTWHALALLMVIIVVRLDRRSPMRYVLLALLIGGCAAFVLLFFRKFADHDYYFLTVMPLVGITMILGSHALLTWPWMSRARGVFTLIVWGIAVASTVLAATELQRRIAKVPDQYSRTGMMLADLSERSKAMDLPANSRIIVIGDLTPNGALTNIHRQGWSYPGYPDRQVPQYQALLANGASHVLVIAPAVRPTLPMEPLLITPRYSLWRIIRPSI